MLNYCLYYSKHTSLLFFVSMSKSVHFQRFKGVKLTDLNDLYSQAKSHYTEEFRVIDTEIQALINDPDHLICRDDVLLFVKWKLKVINRHST